MNREDDAERESHADDVDLDDIDVDVDGRSDADSSCSRSERQLLDATCTPRIREQLSNYVQYSIYDIMKSEWSVLRSLRIIKVLSLMAVIER